MRKQNIQIIKMFFYTDFSSRNTTLTLLLHQIDKYISVFKTGTTAKLLKIKIVIKLLRESKNV